jgi:putative flavoprotein involved in K+ transport
MRSERVPTVVIGGGQAGLSVGYHLTRRGLACVILEANDRIGNNWRRRWDSLRLFTPARFDGLDGMPFPAPPYSFVTKDEMADYLEGYAARFALPVRTGVKVDAVRRRAEGFIVSAGDLELEADHVVVAMANYQQPRVPSFAGTLDPGIVQFHSADYRNPSQLAPGDVLIVGAGNSGAEVAVEVVRAGHKTWMSGRDVGQIPFRIQSLAGRLLLRPLFRGVFHRVLTVDTRIGRKVRAKVISHGAPLIRTRHADLVAAGVERVGRTSGVRGGRPMLDDGRVLDVANVIWCTGFHPGFSWVRLPVFDEAGEPLQQRGFATGEPGLAFVGPHFLYAMSSAMIHGVGRDADRIADAIARREPAQAKAAGLQPALAATST